MTSHPSFAKVAGLAISASTLGPASLSHVYMARLLEQWGDAGLDAFVSSLQRKYARQAALADAAARRHLAGLATWAAPAGGMFMWFKLVGLEDSMELLEAGADAKVAVVPGSVSSVVGAMAAAAAERSSGGGGTNGHAANGHAANGHAANGHAVNGHAANGHAANGHAANGHAANGHPANGYPANGHVTITNGAGANGHHANGGDAAAPIGRAPGEPACPFFRVSFVSVSEEDLEEGFARLAGAIHVLRARHAPKCAAPAAAPAVEALVASGG
jgi:hypothetical protein